MITLLFDLFARHGGAAYLGEPVSQLQHALQAATLAEREGAAPALITAALWLHRYDRRHAGRPWHSSIVAAVAVALGVQVALGMISFVVQDLLLDVAIQ